MFQNRLLINTWYRPTALTVALVTAVNSANGTNTNSLSCHQYYFVISKVYFGLLTIMMNTTLVVLEYLASFKLDGVSVVKVYWIYMDFPSCNKKWQLIFCFSCFLIVYYTETLTLLCVDQFGFYWPTKNEGWHPITWLNISTVGLPINKIVGYRFSLL